MGDRIARSIVLAARPDGGVKESDFRFEASSVPEPGENEMLVCTENLIRVDDLMESPKLAE